MRANTYKLLRQAVEDGARYGARRYYKHQKITPTDHELEAMAGQIADHIMTEVCEWFSFEEDI